MEASFANKPDQRREGAFDFLDSGVQESSGTVHVRALLDNQDRLFWPGQFLHVRLRLDILKNAVLIPVKALQVGQTGPFVFVVKADSTVELRRVKPGQRQAEEVVITEGLASSFLPVGDSGFVLRRAYGRGAVGAGIRRGWKFAPTARRPGSWKRTGFGLGNKPKAASFPI